MCFCLLATANLRQFSNLRKYMLKKMPATPNNKRLADGWSIRGDRVRGLG